jgi:hypothetical protein
MKMQRDGLGACKAVRTKMPALPAISSRRRDRTRDLPLTSSAASTASYSAVLLAFTPLLGTGAQSIRVLDAWRRGWIEPSTQPLGHLLFAPVAGCDREHGVFGFVDARPGAP